MGLKGNTFDAGTAGATITGSNSGGLNGDAFSVTGAGRTYTSDAMHGVLAADFDLASGDAANYVAWAWTADDELVLQVYFKLVAAVTATSPWLAVRASGASILQLMFDTSNRFTVMDATNANKFTSLALTLGAYYRADIRLKVGATTSSSELDVDYYLGDATSPVTTGISIDNANLGVVPADGVRFGFNSSATSARHMRIDSPRARYAEGTAALAPFGINQAPTVSVTPPQTVGAGVAVTATATASDIDGTIAAYAWTVDFPTTGAPALTGASTATVGLTSPGAGTVTALRCTVTDDDGATAYATTEIRVPKSGTTTTLAAAGSGVGAWTNAGGASTEGAALADASDATYIESPAVSSTEVSRRMRLEASTVRATGSFVERLSQDAAGSLTCKVRLFEGTTQRQEWTTTLTTVATDYTFNFSPATVAAIGDWTNLFVEYAATV